MRKWPTCLPSLSEIVRVMPLLAARSFWYQALALQYAYITGRLSLHVRL
jgi:hypothetical protein